ncbi:hypothetical protein ACFL0Z_03410 [Patescibacteria group bacterium]
MRKVLVVLIFSCAATCLGRAGIIKGLESGELPVWAICDREEITKDGALVYHCRQVEADDPRADGWVEVPAPRGGLIALHIENEVKQTKLIFQGMLQSATMFKIYTGELVFEDSEGRRYFAGAISKGRTYSIGPNNTRQASESRSTLLVHWDEDSVGGYIKFYLKLASPSDQDKNFSKGPKD